jgi:hypothetical protein
MFFLFFIFIFQVLYEMKVQKIICIIYRRSKISYYMLLISKRYMCVLSNVHHLDIT